MENKKIVAVDLGTHNVRVGVAMVSEGEKIEVVYHNDFNSAGISRGKVVNPAKLGVVLKNAIGSAEQYLGYKFAQVVVNCQKCEVRSIDKTVSVELDSNTPISSETVELLKDTACGEAVEELGNGEAILCAVAQCYDAGEEMGVDAVDLEGMMVDRLEGRFKIFIGKTSTEKTIEAAFKEAGLDHISPVFCGAEIGRALLSRNELTNGAAIVDFGAGAAAVYIFHSGVLRHYGSVPFGGNSITSDIRNLCDIDERLAENIKLGYGGCMPEKLASLGEKTLRIRDIDNDNKKEITAKYLSEIITARTREIIEAILYEIQLSGYADKLKNGIVLTGGCSTMLNLCHFIKQLSGYNARIASPSQNEFKSESKLFFNPTASISAALLLNASKDASGNYMGESIAPGTEVSVDKGDEGDESNANKVAGKGLFNNGDDDEEDTKPEGSILGLLFGSTASKEEKKKREEEKRAEKERKLAEKRAKEEEKRKKKEEEEMARLKKENDDNIFGDLFGKIQDNIFKDDYDDNGR